jgi:hypothetical protein
MSRHGYAAHLVHAHSSTDEKIPPREDNDGNKRRDDEDTVSPQRGFCD